MYSPQIRDEQIKKIYIIARELALPMTKVVDIAIDDFIKKCDRLKKKKGLDKGV